MVNNDRQCLIRAVNIKNSKHEFRLLACQNMGGSFNGLTSIFIKLSQHFELTAHTGSLYSWELPLDRTAAD